MSHPSTDPRPPAAPATPPSGDGYLGRAPATRPTSATDAAVGATADDAATTGRASDDLDAAQQALVDEGPIPSHIAIIMDGNGRWAREQGQARAQGHREGVSSVRDVTEACAALGVGYLTLYTFSTENWHRPQQEVDALMHLLVHTIERERATLMDNGIRLRVLGDTSRLPAACREQLASTCKATAANDRMTLNLALSYSGRWDLVQAMRRIAAAVEAGTLHADAVDDACISRHLTTAGMPDPDLLIRTGGEYRLSNFLLWQAAYSELYVTDCFWPDFREPELYDAIRSFHGRNRRFGRVEST